MDEMAENIIEEFMMLGYSDEQILHLFQKSAFSGTNMVYKAKGEDYVRGLIQKVRERWGIVPKFNLEYINRTEVKNKSK